MKQTGRNKFRKYKNLILLLVKITSFFPTVINISLLNFFRYTSGNKGYLLRYIFLKNLAKECGDNVLIAENVYLLNIHNLSIGSNISIHPMCYIDAFGGLSISDNVSIAHNSSILTTNHSWDNKNKPIKYNKVISNKVNIKEDVWIGCGCRILAGVTINSRAIIASGAVVNRDVNTKSIFGGIPARLIKDI